MLEIPWFLNVSPKLVQRERKAYCYTKREHGKNFIPDFSKYVSRIISRKTILQH